MVFSIILHLERNEKAFFAASAAFFTSPAPSRTGRSSKRTVATAAVSQKSHSGRNTGLSASAYTTAPSPMPVSITSRSSPSPIRSANHSAAGMTSRRKSVSSAWVSRLFFRRRSRTSPIRSYTAPPASPSATAVR